MNKTPIVIDDPRFLPTKKAKKKMSKQLYKKLNANPSDKDLEQDDFSIKSEDRSNAES